jgi:hypothetical protein
LQCSEGKIKAAAMPIESQVKSLLFIFEEYGIVDMGSLCFTNVNDDRENIKLF